MTDPWKADGPGDCYERAAKRALLLVTQGVPEADVRIVHGLATGTPGTPAEGKRFGHAWVEICNAVVVDGPTEPEFFVRSVYYREGSIDDVHRYAILEACALMDRLEHYGPWHVED
jgi:hypothetical protein